MIHKLLQKRFAIGAFVILSLLMLGRLPTAVHAEGATQIGNFDQQMKGGTFYVDILSAGEVINIALESAYSYTLYDPLGNQRATGSGGQLATYSSNTCSDLTGPIATADKFTTDQPGAWKIVISGSGYCWDISVTPDTNTNPDPTVAAGRLYTYHYNMYARDCYAESSAVDTDFYAMTPGGLEDTHYVWLLDLNNFAGCAYELNANDLGLDSPYSGYSHSTSGASVQDKFPLYLDYPAIAKPAPENPPLASSLRFIDDAGVDATISPGATSGVQDTGFFEFHSDIEGTYALIIDTNLDSQFASGDKLILGNAVQGLNQVAWDGTNPSGSTVSPGTYPAQLKLRGGEFHFISEDVETSGGAEDGLTIRQANADGSFTDVLVYWDDATYTGGTTTLPDGAMSNTSAGHHTWGNYQGSSFGDGKYLDTYVYGQTTVATMEAIVANDDTVIYSPVIDLDANDSSGATGADYQTVWAADGSATPVNIVDADLTITDNDSTQLTQAEITLTVPQTDDTLSIDGSLPAGITLDGASTDTYLKLTGTAVITDYITALGQVVFNNASATPSATQRSLNIVVKDDTSNGNTALVTIYPDNDNDGVSNVEEGNGDSDLDGTPDHEDTDSDNDGIPDSSEGTTDTDGDGLPDRIESNSNDQDNDGTPDYKDLDSDDDGIRDGTEGVEDFDGDNVQNYLDLDSDGDGVDDATEGTADSDADGAPDYLDTDSDNDAIPDSDEGTGDSDGDTLSDRQESNLRDADSDGDKDNDDNDSDGDGIDDGVEGVGDPDDDGIPNYLDSDSDGDGINDATEGSADSDGDTIPNRLEDNGANTDSDGVNNHQDPDDDGDGIPTAVEGEGDTDNDGTPDYLDADSDNDGIGDDVEGTEDTDNDGIPNYIDPDSDGDFISDASEGEDADSDGDGIPDRLEDNTKDTDGDGIADHLDADDDGDGIPNESSGDSDGDGIPDYLDDDSDGDGIPDVTEGDEDSDGDGTPDYLDDDSDGDGESDADEGTTDSDGDGIPDRLEDNTADSDGDGTADHLDDDDDNDGIPTATEGDFDTDGDTTPDYLDTDSDNDGINDATEGTADADSDNVPDRQEDNNADTDNNGTNNHLDNDDDGDGIPTASEGGPTVDSDGDGTPNYLDTDSDNDGTLDGDEAASDTDSDGIPDYLEASSGDTDGDGIPDYQDTDDDGDGIPTATEGNSDSDNDGTPDYLDSDDDGDGIPTATEGTDDVDSDTIPNYLDTDSDGDGIDDVDERNVDTDGDSTADYLDTDSDNDGVDDDVEGATDSDGDTVPDRLEASDADTDNDGTFNEQDDDDDGDGIPTATEGTGDRDQDGAPNYLDSDSDGDGLTDADEGTADLDSDGAPNYLDPDDDGDGIATAAEGTEDSDSDGIPDAYESNTTDSDSDGTYDPQDTDDDGDGIPTATEGDTSVDTDSDGTADYLDDDSDGDGLTDTTEGATDSDGDGTPDFQDSDSDDDGTADSDEGAGDTDGDGIPDRLESNTADLDGDGSNDYNDADDDGDGVLTSVEGDAADDSDGDTTPDYRDTDDDDDGILTATEGDETVDTDGDTTPDYLDTDSDDDGLTDADEGTTDSDSDTIPNRLEDNDADTDSDSLNNHEDSDDDGDGVPTADEGSGDLDGDGLPNYLDPDSDNDGTPDGDEGATDDTFSVAEDSSNNALDVLANDSDIDGDTLTIVAVGSPDQGGTAVHSSTQITYTPAANFVGDEQFIYSISDGKGFYDTATVTVTVTSTNDEPVAVDDAFDADEEIPTPVNVLANDSDIDGDTLTIFAVGTPDQGGTAVSAGTIITYTGAAEFAGTELFTYTVSDGNGGFSSATVTMTVANLNDAPTVVDDTFTVDEDETNSLTPLANDSDADGDTLTISAIGTPDQGGTAVSTGTTITYTPTLNFVGVESFSYTAADGNGGTATATITVTVNNVNDDPVAGNDTFTVTEDSSDNALDVLTNDNDPVEGDTITITAVGTPDQSGTATHDSAQISYTPAPNFFGNEVFTYTISDGNGGFSSATVTMTVSNLNDQPTAHDDTFTIDEDSVDNELDVQANDTDLDGDTLTISALGIPDHGTASHDGSTVTYTPEANFFGTDTFHYTISDGNGTFSTASITVNVNSVNDPPEATDDAFTIIEDTTNNSLAVLSNDDDPVESDPLTVSAVGSPDNGGTAVANGSTITYTPESDFFGTEVFTYTVSDGNGGTDIATVTITVENVNDDPNAKNDGYMIEENTPAVFTPLANDSDADGDTLTITHVSSPDNGGTAVLDGDNINYTPPADYHGVEIFTYTISDGNGSSDTAAIAVTVNALPVAVPDSFAIDEDSSEQSWDVLANDSDPDDDELTLMSVSAATLGSSVSVDGSLIRYTPAPNAFGTEVFTYTVRDTFNGRAAATVTVTLTGIEDAPIAHNDGRVTSANEAVTLQPMANDEEVDGQTLTLVSVSQPASGGTTTRSGDEVTFTPATGFTGTTTFSYTISDGALTDSGTVTIVVTGGVASDPVDAGSDMEIVIPETGAHDTITNTIQIPAGAVLAEDAADMFTLVYREVDNTELADETHTFAYAFDLDAYQNGTLLADYSFVEPITMTLTYDDSDLKDMDESSVALYYWDGSQWQQDGIVLVHHDTDNNEIVFTLAHLTRFGLSADTTTFELFLPVVIAP